VLRTFRSYFFTFVLPCLVSSKEATKERGEDLLLFPARRLWHGPTRKPANRLQIRLTSAWAARSEVCRMSRLLQLSSAQFAPAVRALFVPSFCRPIFFFIMVRVFYGSDGPRHQFVSFVGGKGAVVAAASRVVAS
jgi:hypothetical protein